MLSPAICTVLVACSPAHSSSDLNAAQIRAKLQAIPFDQEVHLTNKEWQVIMSPQQFYVMRRAGNDGDPASDGPDEDAKVIVRSNGTVTYVGKDIAYHLYRLAEFLAADSQTSPARKQHSLSDFWQGNFVRALWLASWTRLQ